MAVHTQTDSSTTRHLDNHNHSCSPSNDPTISNVTGRMNSKQHVSALSPTGRALLYDVRERALNKIGSIQTEVEEFAWTANATMSVAGVLILAELTFWLITWLLVLGFVHMRAETIGPTLAIISALTSFTVVWISAFALMLSHIPREFGRASSTLLNDARLLQN